MIATISHAVSNALRVRICRWLLAAFLIPSAPAGAATYTVITTADSGAGSLRQAIIDSENNAGANTISLTVTGVVNLDSALPVVYNDVSIVGPGPEQLTVRRHTQGEAPDFRIFQFFANAASLSGVTISDGAANTGAGVYNGGSLLLQNCVITGNRGYGNGCGAGVFNGGQLTVMNCTISGNYGYGGAFYGAGIDQAGIGSASASPGGGEASASFAPLLLPPTLDIVNTVIANNHAEGRGGAVYVSGGLVNIHGSTIESNTATVSGGGFYLDFASCLVSNSLIRANDTPAVGGGIKLDGGDLTVMDVTFANNHAGTTGGGLNISSGSAAVARSTFTENLAGTSGGGIATASHDLTLVNSTLSGNSSLSSGGGIYIQTGSVRVRSATISGNYAINDGGGIHNADAVLLELRNTIVAENTCTSSPDIRGEIFSLGFNLIGNDQASSGAVNGVAGDQVGTAAAPINPLLGPLQDNGGPTHTRALLPGSPAINAGGNSNAPATDQRGLARVVGGRIDIGAFEVQPAAVLAFTMSSYSVAESGTNATITVERTGDTAGLVTVQYTTDIGAAVPGVDYLPSNGTLDFADGETEQTFDVAVLDNLLADGDRGLILLLSNPTGGATLGVPATATLTIVDEEAAPVITCPDDITADNAPGFCSAQVSFSATATGFPAPTVVCEPPSGSNFPVGTNGVTCLASNSAGTAQCSFTVTVNDAEVPAIGCPANLTGVADLGACAKSNVTWTVTSSDNCAVINMICDPASGATFPVGVTAVSCGVADAGGNTNGCTFTVTISDTEAPAIGCPADLTVMADAESCSKSDLTWTVTSSDNCAVINMICDPASGATFPVGVTTVSCGVADAGGNTNGCTFTVTVTDSIPPFVYCPPPILVTPDEGGTTRSNVTFSAYAYAYCSETELEVFCTPPSGSTFPAGITMVTCVATGTGGGIGSCEFPVRVTGPGGPQIGGQLYATGGDILVEVLPATAGYTSELWLFSPAPPRFIALNRNEGTIVNLGSFPAGVELIFSIYVRDTGDTFYTGPGSRNLDGIPHASVDSQGPGLAIVGFEDLLYGGDLDYDDNVFRFTGGITPLGCVADITVPAEPEQCSATVEYSVTPPDGSTVVCTPPSGTVFANGRTTVNCVATYMDGRTRMCGFNVTVVDGDAPSINCPPSLLLNADAGQATRTNVTYNASVSDNCPGAVVSCAPSSGSTFPAGVTTVNCVATDSSDNTNTCAFTVTVIAEVLVVSNAGDAGPGTLRQALLDANMAPGLNRIIFQLPGTPPHVIRLFSALPAITDPVVINGGGSNGVPAIELDGRDAAFVTGSPGGGLAGSMYAVDGLVITAGNTVVQGMTFYGFATGIRIAVNGNNRIEGNFIGTDATRSITTGNTSDGIVVNSSGNVIGGTAPGTGNVIVHSGGDGVALGSGATGNRILDNIISDNARNGVALDIYAGVRNLISGNSIFNNGALGVDLGGDGPTPNDSGDSDGGPNALQNFPVLTDARSFDGITTVEGVMSGASNRNYRVQFFLNDTLDGSGHGEGQFFLGAITVTTSAAGSQNFSVTFPVDAGSTQSVSAIATDPLNNSSEFSVGVTVRTAPVIIVHPVGINTAPGAMATFCVTALSSTPISYQWRHNGVNIPGATGVCYTIPSVTVTDGGSYEVAVANDVGAVSSNPADLLLTSVPPLAGGDNFVDRVPIFGTNGSVAGVNDFATFEPGEPNHAGKPGGKSVWYTWTAPATGIATFRTTGSTFDTLLGVYTGTNVASLTRVAGDEDRAGFYASVVMFNAVAGTTYHIAIDGFDGETGQFTFSWALEVTAQLLPVIDLQPASATTGPLSNHTFTVTATSMCKRGHKGCRERKHFDDWNDDWNNRWGRNWDDDDDDDGDSHDRWHCRWGFRWHDRHHVKKPKKPKKSQLSYQWYFFGEAIPGATGTSYTVTNVGPGNVGEYTVAVRCGDRIVESIVAVLQINLTDGVVQQVRAEDKLPDALRGEPIRLGTAPGPFRAAQTVGGAPVAAIGGFSRGYTGSQVFNNSSASSVSFELPCGVVGGASMWLPMEADETGTLVISSSGTNTVSHTSFRTLLAAYEVSAANPDDLIFRGCGMVPAMAGPPTVLSFEVATGVTYLLGFDSVGGASGDLIVNYSLIPPGTMTPLGPVAGGFQLQVTTRAGQRFSIEASSNLVNWASLVTAVNTTGSLVYTDTTAPVGVPRFYRLALLP